MYFSRNSRNGSSTPKACAFRLLKKKITATTTINNNNNDIVKKFRRFVQSVDGWLTIFTCYPYKYIVRKLKISNRGYIPMKIIRAKQ